MTLATALAILLAPVAGLLLLPLVSDLLVLSRPRSLRLTRSAASDGEARSRLLFLVPAHNESLLIDACIRSLVGMERRQSSSDVFVIADNCTDNTVEVSAAAGAGVLSRFDETLRGKPHAIAWALTQLPVSRYDAVVIIDADTVVDAHFADALASHAPLRDIAVQAYFGISNERDSWLSLLAGLLAKIRYEGQYVAKSQAGLNCPLTGNGMCLGTALLARAGWAPESLTENWELYARYTARGEIIRFSSGALLYSQEARTLEQSTTQRKRWQAGRLKVLRDYWRDIVGSKRITLHQKIDAVAELSSLGPVLSATFGALAATLLWQLPGVASRMIAVVFLLSLLPMIAWTLFVLAKQPNRGAIAVAFLRLPVYIVWRVVVAALSLTTGARGIWHRSPRHSP